MSWLAAARQNHPPPADAVPLNPADPGLCSTCGWAATGRSRVRAMPGPQGARAPG